MEGGWGGGKRSQQRRQPWDSMDGKRQCVKDGDLPLKALIKQRHQKDHLSCGCTAWGYRCIDALMSKYVNTAHAASSGDVISLISQDVIYATYMYCIAALLWCSFASLETLRLCGSYVLYHLVLIYCQCSPLCPEEVLTHERVSRKWGKGSSIAKLPQCPCVLVCLCLPLSKILHIGSCI